MFILTHIIIIINIMYCIPNQIGYSPHTINTAEAIQKIRNMGNNL